MTAWLINILIFIGLCLSSCDISECNDEDDGLYVIDRIDLLDYLECKDICICTVDIYQ